jgi:hypothetical protein
VPHPFRVFRKGAGVGSDLPALPFGQFSTARSNGTNKVIDTQGTFLVFLPVFAQSNFARIAPEHRQFAAPGHSTPLLPTASGLFYVNGGPQPLFFQSPADSFHRNGGCTPLASTSSSANLRLLFPECTQILEIRPSQESPVLFFTVPGSRVTYSFRINTCKSVSKQMTLTLFRMNTYEKTGGWGRCLPRALRVSRRVAPSPSLQNFIPEATAVLGCPTKVTPRHSSLLLRGGCS